jgi:hypothetical protein
MKSLLVSGHDAPPADLVDIVEQGSTSVDRVSTAELSTFVSRAGFGVDRVVFWAGGADADLRSVAINYASSADAASGQAIVYVTPTASDPAPIGVAQDSCFVWPRDKDKLKMIFMTGA